MDHAVLELPPYQSLDGTNTKSNSLGGVLRAREIVHAGGFVVALAQARGVLESEALENAAVETFDRRP
jgi:hypothetical protein